MKKLQCILFCTLFVSDGFGETNRFGKEIIPVLDADSQSNIVIFANLDHPTACPSEYTNVMSNTNLFTPMEQKLLDEIPSKYRNVTTNFGPSGTVVVRSEETTNGLWMARFQYTNSAATDEVTFGAAMAVRFRTTTGDGYNVDMVDGSILNFQQVEHNQINGLVASFYNGYCSSWTHFTKGKAVGKWLMWGSANRLFIEAEFKEPYDLLKHAHRIRM